MKGSDFGVKFWQISCIKINEDAAVLRRQHSLLKKTKKPLGYFCPRGFLQCKNVNVSVVFAVFNQRYGRNQCYNCTQEEHCVQFVQTKIQNLNVHPLSDTYKKRYRK